MDLPKNRKSLETELTPEIIIKSILALEEEKAKKTFSSLKHGLEILVNRGEISPEVAKDFRILKNKFLSKEKEDIMDKNKAEKRDEKDNGNKKALMTAAEIGKMLYENGWAITFLLDRKGAKDQKINLDGLTMNAEYDDGKVKHFLSIVRISSASVPPSEEPEKYEMVTVLLKKIPSSDSFSATVDMPTLEKIAQDPANARYAVKTPEEGKWDIRILLEDNEERSFEIFHMHKSDPGSKSFCETIEEKDGLKTIRCKGCGAKKELDISNYVRQNVFMMKIVKKGKDLVIADFRHYHEDGLHPCKIEDITIEDTFSPERKTITCETCGETGMYTPELFRLVKLDKVK